MSKILILQNPIATKIEAENISEILWLASQKNISQLKTLMTKLFMGVRYIDAGFLHSLKLLPPTDTNVDILGTVKTSAGVFRILPHAIPIYRKLIENKIDYFTQGDLPRQEYPTLLHTISNLQAVIQNQKLEIVIRI